ncbi:uncharacterized protein [Amphiura filiformis]|uniref:uncharacterized protein n=1 Tax=Amphiura filiformis TaxID=82378 RepID=UPI003B214A9E
MNHIGISNFLEPVGLLRYCDVFQIKGYDVETDFCTLTSEDLDDMNIKDEDHRATLLHAAQNYKPSTQYEVFKWLRDHGIEYYFTNFIRSNYNSLRELTRLELTADVLHELEIQLPGHRKRLQQALPTLRTRRRIEEMEAEPPVAMGYWGKPLLLEGAKYDFLCIRATLRSSKPNGARFNEEFMVDSGSDVVTARQEILDKLDLELIGTIQSRGVHSTVEKQLYKAMLCIGRQEIEIEIMAEPYESIGNRVMRHFRHVIDSTVHYWLPGNHVDPIELEDIAGPSTSGLTPGPSTREQEPRRSERHIEPHEFVVPEVPRTGQTKRESTEEEPKSKKRKTKARKEATD